MLMHPRGQEPQLLTPTNAIAIRFRKKEVMRKEEDEETRRVYDRTTRD
jgi:hypothetical protein